ncbi:MAG TPA: hypothetical protein VGP47_06590 [Parachlamydiaceae bacterium]|nr:hypothetical protein [Parachlamydiaceae bacterium]
MHSLMLVIVSLTLTLLTSCSSCWNPFDLSFDSNNEAECNDVPEAPYVDLPHPCLSIHAEEITAIVQEYSVELKNRKHLHLEHANTFYNDAGIHTVQMQFISQDIIELCEARKLIIDVSEGMLEQLNSNPLLIPEFANQGFYPFNLEIYINFESYYIKYVDPFYIKWIVMEDAQILYYTGDVNDNDKNGWHYRKESYNTSRNIVLYQRLAEDRYKAMHEADRSVFGDKRFYVDEPLKSSKRYQ